MDGWVNKSLDFDIADHCSLVVSYKQRSLWQSFLYLSLNHSGVRSENSFIFATVIYNI